MIAVITGDVVSSRKMPPRSGWMKRLTQALEAPSNGPVRWAVFRGDGFQVEIQRPAEALKIALMIRAALKSMEGLHQIGLDARIGIGLGEKGYSGQSVGMSDGEAYRLSGTLLDTLKEEGERLKISTGTSSFDRRMNICMALTNAIVEDWSQRSAELVWLRLSDPLATQERLARKLKISQPAVFKRDTASHIREIEDVVEFFREEVSNYTMSEKKHKAVTK